MLEDRLGSEDCLRVFGVLQDSAVVRLDVAYEVLGDRAGEFEEELRRDLSASDPNGLFPQTISFAYEPARRPT